MAIGEDVGWKMGSMTDISSTTDGGTCDWQAMRIPTS